MSVSTVFIVRFDGLFVKMQNILASGRVACKAYNCARQKWSVSTLRSQPLSSYCFTFFRQSVILRSAKCQSSHLHGSASQFQKRFGFSYLSSPTHYSTQSQPNQRTGSNAKDFEDINNMMEQYNAKPLPPVMEQSRISIKDVVTAVKEPVASDLHDAKYAQSSVEAANGVTNLSKDSEENSSVIEEKRPGIFKRFHQTYKQYGKVLVGVHIFTSSIWTGIFYVTAMSGVNVEPFLRWVGAGDSIISFYTMPGVGHLAVTYLMYKLATPARYAVTIGGTHMAVKWLTHWGYMKPIPQSDNLKSLVKDGKTKVKAKYEKYQDKIDDIRDEIKELRSKESKIK